jgi:hypothetical protein
MAVYTQVDDSTEYFQTVMYQGNGSADRTITWTGNSNLQADWLWGKCSSETTNHYLNDTSRGITINLHSNTNDQDATDSNIFTSVGSNSFVVGSDGDINGASRENIVWGWKANGGTTSTNSDGDISVTVQVNSTAGFSIITDSPGNNTARTIGHGLGAKPDLIIRRARNRTEDWCVYHSAFESTLPGGFQGLNTTAAYNDSATTLFTSVSNTTFGVGTDFSVNGGFNYITYAFKNVQGFSRFGKYIGNGNANGPFIYLGFTPSLIWIKRIDSTGNWVMHSFDQGTNSSTGVGAGNDWNLNNNNLETNDDDSQNQYGAIDMLSNGFKVRNATNAFGAADENADGGTYIYMAWAYNPFATSTGVAAPAR